MILGGLVIHNFGNYATINPVYFDLVFGNNKKAENVVKGKSIVKLPNVLERSIDWFVSL